LITPPCSGLLRILGKSNFEAVFWESHEPQKTAFVEFFGFDGVVGEPPYDHGGIHPPGYGGIYPEFFACWEL
jgi:hypothetical protein